MLARHMEQLELGVEVSRRMYLASLREVDKTVGQIHQKATLDRGDLASERMLYRAKLQCFCDYIRAVRELDEPRLMESQVSGTLGCVEVMRDKLGVAIPDRIVAKLRKDKAVYEAQVAAIHVPEFQSGDLDPQPAPADDLLDELTKLSARVMAYHDEEECRGEDTGIEVDDDEELRGDEEEAKSRPGV